MIRPTRSEHDAQRKRRRNSRQREQEEHTDGPIELLRERRSEMRQGQAVRLVPSKEVPIGMELVLNCAPRQRPLVLTLEQAIALLALLATKI